MPKIKNIKLSNRNSEIDNKKIRARKLKNWKSTNLKRGQFLLHRQYKLYKKIIIKNTAFLKIPISNRSKNRIPRRMFFKQRIA